MPLRHVPFKAVYRSEDDSLLHDFYLPALKASTRYDRAVGFFSAGMLSYAAQGLSAFIANAGRMRLVFGGDLTPEDAEAMQRGYDLRPISDRIGADIVRALESVEELLYNKRLEALAYMIAGGRLEVKVALRARGMYHEKIGIFRDGEHTVVFQGSANETTHALLSDFNFESINVFPSWRTELSDHAQPYIDGFERLWANKSRGTLVLDFPDAAKEKLLRIASRAVPPMTPAVELALAERRQNEERGASEHQSQEPTIPAYFAGEAFKLREHQSRALNAWKGNAFRGLLAHATGSGKTVTAIYGATRLFEYMRRLFLIVAVPYVNLAEQWLRVLRSFNITALGCFGSMTRWSKSLAEVVDSFRLGGTPFACAVVVERTLVGSDFQAALARIPGDHLLFVGDECHHHTAIVHRLPEHARLRLGLSATPEEALTGEVPAQLIGYYGGVVDRFGLADALEAKLLTPYEYHVVPVELTPPEIEEYVEITAELGRSAGGKDDAPFSEGTKRLLFQRSRLLGRAEAKLAALRALLGRIKAQPLTLFYCGDGSTEDETTGESIRQVEAVSRILYEHHWRPAIFTAAEDKKEREAILRQFSVGDIDALVAIRCLDEGIDIPACRAAYILASAQSPRQYVQRRGRVLRRSINKERAFVTDFLVSVPTSIGEGENYARNLLRSELKRVAEFAHLAINSVAAYRELRELLEAYDLVHLLAD